jgi:hypothetical protein
VWSGKKVALRVGGPVASSSPPLDVDVVLVGGGVATFATAALAVVAFHETGCIG